MNYQKGWCQCEAPCKCQPIVLPVQECICNRCYYVEQPIIVPHNTRVVNHYIPRPVYYHTYSQSEENMCHGETMNKMAR